MGCRAKCRKLMRVTMPEPFLKWPGGKRWLTRRHTDLFPAKFGRYIEPFLGGGAVFFGLKPKDARLSDTNSELINAYNQIKDEWAALEKTLRQYQIKHNKSFYYKVRGQLLKDPVAQAARFLYLNRTCFNGIYRVNRKGEFNVPIGTKSAVAFEDGYLESVAAALRDTLIRQLDFAKAIDEATGGDFVFVDPPYTVMHNNNDFVKYNALLFSWADQTRLAKAIRAAAARGVLVMMSNANHSSVRALYADFGLHHILTRSSVLAGDPSRRQASTELLVTNY